MNPNITWASETAVWSDRTLPEDQWNLATLEPTDTLSVSLGEVATIAESALDVSKTDDAIIQLLEGVTELSSFSELSDSLALGFVESTEVAVLVGTQDSLICGISDLATPQASLDSVDALVCGITEAAATFPETLPTESLAIGVSEVSEVVVLVTLTETLLISLAEQGSMGRALASSDNLLVGLGNEDAGWCAALWRTEPALSSVWSSESPVPVPPNICSE